MGIIVENGRTGSNATLFVGSPLVVEGYSGSHLAPFDVCLSESYFCAFNVDDTSLDGSAIAGQDYTATTGSRNFAAEQTVTYVEVSVLGDTAVENTESFSLNVTPPAAALSTAAKLGAAAILNDVTVTAVPSPT